MSVLTAALRRIGLVLGATAVIAAAWWAFLFLSGIDAGPLYRTESLRAIIGRECLHGHWLYPVLYGEPFLTKPPGHYDAIGLCSLPFGEVSAAEFPDYHVAYNAAIPVVVIVPGFLSFLSSAALPWTRPADISRRTAAVVFSK